MAQLPNMSMLRLQPCAVTTGARAKRKEPVPPARPPGPPEKKRKDSQYYRNAVEGFFAEHVLTPAQRRELLAIIAEDKPAHAFGEEDWIMAALPPSWIAEIPGLDTDAGRWRWKAEQLSLAIVELHKRETSRKKKKGAPGSSAQTSKKKTKSNQQAADDAENAKKPRAVMGREVLSDTQKEELFKKFPTMDNSSTVRVLGAKKAQSCCMQRR
jgi:hypothetical protein